MRGLAQRAAGNEEQRRALRLHNRKYRMSETTRQRLIRVRESLFEANEALLIALDEGCDENSTAGVALRFGTALKLLTEGPGGEFK